MKLDIANTIWNKKGTHCVLDIPEFAEIAEYMDVELKDKNGDRIGWSDKSPPAKEPEFETTVPKAFGVLDVPEKLDIFSEKIDHLNDKLEKMNESNIDNLLNFINVVENGFQQFSDKLGTQTTVISQLASFMIGKSTTSPEPKPPEPEPKPKSKFKPTDGSSLQYI
jgi:hypothetical protein